ncbi:MAG: TolC family protein [Methyloglobulus sp.]|nr:TolC family protein [Methyloglobulus sp.]
MGGIFMMFVGCTSHPNDIKAVSDSLEHRTGYGLNTKPAKKLAWPPGVAIKDGLTEDELVALALWNNAAFQETLVDLQLSRADLIQAGMLPNPTLWMLFPVGIKPLELLLRYPLEAFWLRADRVESAEQDVQRTAQRLVQNGLDVIRDARLASAELTLAKQRLDYADNTAHLAANVAELTQARLNAGDATELEVANAKVDAKQAEEQRLRWQHDVEIANQRLRTLVGLGLEHWPRIIKPSPLLSNIPAESKALVEEALKARPDLYAAELNLAAMGERIGLARAEVFTITAILSTKDVNGQTVSGPGLDIALPIFNQNQGGVAQAKARFEKAARSYTTLRDRIVLEVREAFTRLQQAHASLNQWQTEILPPLNEAVKNAEKAYGHGNVSYLFVLEAQRKSLDAQLKAVAAEADLRRVRAELERSIGRSLDHPSIAFTIPKP